MKLLVIAQVYFEPIQDSSAMLASHHWSKTVLVVVPEYSRGPEAITDYDVL